MSCQNKSAVTKAKSFLNKLGLSYDSASPAIQRYLLDMIPSGSIDVSSVSGSVISNKFNKEVNSNMSGGRVSLPLEYFGVETNNYNATPSEVVTDSSLARPGLSFTGGSSLPKLLTQSDLKNLSSCYENKFLRKLKLNQREKKALLNKLNEDISMAVIDAVKMNKYGRLTKHMLEKKLKN